MSHETQKNLKVRCQITGQDIPLDMAVPVDLVRDSILDVIRKQHPNVGQDGYVSLAAVNQARVKHVEQMATSEQDEMQDLRREIAKSLLEHETLAKNVDFEFDESLTFGNRLADKVAEFGGSWKFIIIFGVILFGWMGVNAGVLISKPFDPFPFIFLNLILSCLAAVQAPVIMMSQNRQESKDRMRSENDYKVNLKAEIEIRALHDKLDKLLNDQWKHLLEIQQMQMEMINEISKGS